MQVKQVFKIAAVLALYVCAMNVAGMFFACSLGETGTVSQKVVWTSTGDDGYVGTATSYIMRYSEDSLALANDFDNCPIACLDVSGLPWPLLAGSKQSVVITGLEPNTKYFVAAQAVDEAGNKSETSNIVGFETPDTDPPGRITDLRIE